MGAAVKIQAYWKGQKVREEYKKQKEAAVKIQAYWKGHKVREEYKIRRKKMKKKTNGYTNHDIYVWHLNAHDFDLFDKKKLLFFLLIIDMNVHQPTIAHTDYYTHSFFKTNTNINQHPTRL